MIHLLKHFTRLSLHPKNAAELKGLILQLAVHGKLTAKWREENPDVEPTSVLLERINSEKKKSVELKIYKAKYDTDFFEPLIVRPNIPDKWEYATIGNLCELMTGATPSRAKSIFFGGNIKWLVSGDIHKGYIHDCEGRITELGMASSNCKILPINSILIALNGQGKTRATVALLKTEATCNQSLVAMKPFIEEEILSEYIYYSLKGKYYQIRDITGQKQRRGLNMTLVSQLPIALPPLEEQKAIVEVVNQLFAEVEQLQTLTKERIQLKEDFVTSALQKLSTGDTTSEWTFLQEHFGNFFTEQGNIKKLRESILQLAVQGKLTKHWRKENPDVEPTSVLLERINSEKKKSVELKIYKAKYDTDFFEPLIVRPNIPDKWEYATIGNLCELMTGATPSRAKSIFFGGNIKWLVSGDIHKGYIHDCEGRITELGMASSNCKILPINSILIALNGQGKTRATVALLKTEATCNQSLVAMKPFIEEEILSEYIYYSLKGKYYQIRHITGQKQRRGLNMTLVSQLPIALPPLEEQKAIVEKVNSLMDLCDQLEQAIQTSKATQEDWMKSSLREVFEIEPVPLR